jgi:hypothetical protein
MLSPLYGTIDVKDRFKKMKCNKSFLQDLDFLIVKNQFALTICEEYLVQHMV